MGILTRRPWSGIAPLACAVLCLFLPPARAQDGKPLQLYEQKIKAGLVYNFLKYTKWPESAPASDQGNLRICLLGGDLFDGYLSPLNGRTAQQYVIAVARIEQVREADNCNIVVIGRNQEGSLPELFDFLEGKNILTVSDITHFARQGGMVELTKEGDKINLYINREAVEHSGLDIEDRMLRLAKMVSG